jgi:crossover junction endodeoxyribonuclease RusA
MGIGMIEFTFPFPPSVNHTWMRGKGNRLYSNAKVKDFHKAATAVIQAKALVNPLQDRLRVEFVINEKDKRRRDMDNYTKSVFDACTKNNVWEDDSQIDELIIRRGEINKEFPNVVVRVTEL